MHQINDVVLGAVQHSLKEISYNFLPIIKNNFWTNNKTGHIMKHGFNIYPVNPRTDYMKNKLAFLESKFIRLTY